jgi:hypothetical protein
MSLKGERGREDRAAQTTRGSRAASPDIAASSAQGPILGAGDVLHNRVDGGARRGCVHVGVYRGIVAAEGYRNQILQMASEVLGSSV